jgi:hypothetical protein
MRRKAILLVKWLAVSGLVFSLTPFSFTQSAEKDRIVQAIDDSSRVTLQGNVRPMFRPENDMGPVDKPQIVDRPVRHIDLCPTLAGLLGCAPLAELAV